MSLSNISGQTIRILVFLQVLLQCLAVQVVPAILGTAANGSSLLEKDSSILIHPRKEGLLVEVADVSVEPRQFPLHVTY